MSDRVAAIEMRLHRALQPQDLRISDDSAAHAGHTGARSGGHFEVFIVSPQFTGKTLLQRHRMVYAAVRDIMQTDIHALSITALSPTEL